MALCSPWVTPEAITYCAGADFDDGKLARAAEAASGLLYVASGRQFPGVCTDTVHPCAGGCSVQWLNYPDGYEPASRPLPLHGYLPLWAGVGLDGSTLRCGEQIYNAVRLPNVAVVDVTEIIINGDVVANVADAVRIVDDRWLLRASGAWPCCADLGDPTSFAVTYRWGAAPPAEALLAAEVLACELAKSWAKDTSCRLPKRLTQLVREGVSMTFLDPFEFLDDGRFGIYEVDTFLSTYNPDGLRRPARIVDPGLEASRARRVR